MKNMVGGPGTVSGLLLRIGQCLFAAASIGAMVSSLGFSSYTAFCCQSMVFQKEEEEEEEVAKARRLTFGSNWYWLLAAASFFRKSYLIASMGLQVLWSFGLACLDVYALRIKRDLQNPVLVSLFVVGDWVTATLSLAASCSSAGVTVLFTRDVDYCLTQPFLPCARFQISIALAFITWLLIAISSLVMFWLLASV